MVDKNEIENILNSVLKNKSILTVKCHYTIAEMHEKLNAMTQEEKEKALLELLDENQIHYYRFLRSGLNWANEELGVSEDNTYIDVVDGELVRREYDDEYWNEFLESDEDLRDKEFILMKQDCEKGLFKYERKIIEGYKKNNTEPNVNVDDYKEDTQYGIHDRNNELGELEQRLVDKQQQVDLSQKSIDGCNYWFTSANINHEIYNTHDWRKLGLESPATQKGISNRNNKAKRIIDNVFKELPVVGEKIKGYRAGNFDGLLQVGDTFKFKGYTSLTTQKKSANQYRNVKNTESGEFDMGGSQWMYTICIDENNKVLCGNDSRFNNGVDEHELVLPRNVEAKVVSVDYNRQEVVIQV